MPDPLTGSDPAARESRPLPDGDPEVAELEAEITRLNKIVQALMDRSESAASSPGSYYGLFQTTVMLQNQVRLRTAEARESLHDDESTASSLAESAAKDMHALRRTAALQIQLLELVAQQKDLGELIERVAALLEVPIVLFDTRGAAVYRSRGAGSEALARRLWKAYVALQGSPGALGVAERDGERIYFRDIVVMDRVERVLAAVAAGGEASEFADASLSFLQQLVTLDVLRHRDELAMRRRERQRLLRDVLTGVGTPDELTSRLQDQGFDDSGPWRVVVVEPAPVQPPGRHRSGRGGERLAEKLLAAVEAVCNQRRMVSLGTVIGPDVAVLTAFDDDPAAASVLLAELHATLRTVSPCEVVVGCSAVLRGAAGAPRALQQAHAAGIAARRDPAAGGAVVFDRLSGQLRLLDGLDEEALADVVQRTFAPLLDYDAQHRSQLFETLRTLFDHHLAVQETAAVLHVHRNTLTKRLEHVEQLLHIDLDVLDDVVDVRLGLHAAELLGKRPAL